MWAPIARKIVVPSHERLLGRPTMRYLRELDVSQWLSPSALREVQGHKLRELLRHAHANVPFYRRRMKRADVDIDASDPFDALSRLPLLDKPTIRRCVKAMLWHDAPGGLFPYDTGGSSGEPLQFFLDRRRQAYDQAARMRAHRWFGIDVGERELFLWGSPIEWSRTDRIKRIRDALFNHRLLDAFNMSEERMDRYLDELERFNPTCLFGYPSSVSLLVDHARKRGRTLRTPGMKAAFVSGEVCFPHDRASIAEFFGVPVADNYGSREGGFIAHECPKGAMHVTAENVLVEVINKGEPAKPGEAGEIVVTHLDAYAMPFIRYRTGDIGRLRDGRCACGRGLPLFDVVEGRTTDFLYLPNGDIKHALSVIYPMRALPGVRQFRVMQDVDYAVTVEVVPEKHGPRVTAQIVARSVGEVLGESIDLRVELVPSIPATASGKLHYVSSQAATRSVPPEEVAPGV